MKKSSINLALYALAGWAIFLFLAFLNQKVLGYRVTFAFLVVPGLLGGFGGLYVGYTRKRWGEKCAELDASAENLEQQLLTVKDEREHADNLHRLVANIPLPVYLKDKDHRYLWANSHFETLAGKPFSEIKSNSDFEIFPPPVAELFREQDLDVIKKEIPQTFEETVPLPGGIITFETFKFPIKNESGNIYAVGGVCTDITQLKAADDRLVSEQKRLDTILRHVEVGVVATDSSGEITRFNPKAAALLNFNSNDAMGMVLDEVYRANDALTGAPVHLSSGLSYGNTDEPTAKEIVLIDADNQEKRLNQKTVPLLDGFGQYAGMLLLLREKPSLKESNGEQSNTLRGKNYSAKDSEEALETKGLILVMDDDRLVRKTTKLMLNRGGYEVLLAKNGEDAISMYRQQMKTAQPINAIIMDLTVPGSMGGVEATEKILALDADAKILVASGYSNDQVLANYLDYGFLARVEKPFDLAVLLSTIESTLR